MAASSSLPDGEKIVFFGSGNDFVPRKPLDVVCEPFANNTFTSLGDLVGTLVHDDVLFCSILRGVPPEDCDTLARHLAGLLRVACEASPVDASRLFFVLLRSELRAATQGRGDVHTFMRGNGVVPKTFEFFLAELSGAEGGLEGRLLRCCAVLRDDGGACSLVASQCTSEGNGGDSSGQTEGCSAGEVTPPHLLLRGIDYFNDLTELSLSSEGDGSKDREIYAGALMEMLHRILDAAHASLSQWPWSLRASLRFLLDSVGSLSHEDTQPVYANCDPTSLTLLEQNMIATIVVLWAVVPALLGTASRLLPGKDYLDPHYTRVQRRCTLLARLVQKAAYGQLFSGAHETGMRILNSKLPTLAHRWKAVFVQICTQEEPPAPRTGMDVVRSGEEATLQFREFLDHYFLH